MNRITAIALGATLAATAAIAQEVPTGGYQFQTPLSGAQEVPPVETAGTGDFSITFNEALDQAQYTLQFSDTGTPATAAHLHCAPAGVNGEVVVPLALPTEGGGQQTLTNADVQALTDNEACGVPINNLASVVGAILDNRIYVNVHTEQNPQGELRGQLFWQAGEVVGGTDEGTIDETP